MHLVTYYEHAMEHAVALTYIGTTVVYWMLRSLTQNKYILKFTTIAWILFTVLAIGVFTVI